MSVCLSPGALPREQRALYRSSSTTQEGSARRTDAVSGCLLPQPPLRWLRWGGPDRARVRPPARQEILDLGGRSRPPLAGRPRRDCKVRRRLCKLSSAPHREAGWLHTRGG